MRKQRAPCVGTYKRHVKTKQKGVDVNETGCSQGGSAVIKLTGAQG
jgi:hypothetical protein